MGEISTQFRLIYREYETNGVQSSGLHRPEKAEIRELGDLIDVSVEGAAAGQVAAETWAALSAIAGTRVGQPAYVPRTDAGSHTDPVVGGSVFNQGSYRWVTDSPGGWLRIDDYPDLNPIQASTGAPDADKAIATDGSGLLDISFLPSIFKVYQDEGQYSGWGDGLRSLHAAADDEKGTIVGPWANAVSDLARVPSVRPKLYLWGDSRADQCSTDYSTEARSWLWWVGFLSGWPFDFQPSQNVGVASTESWEAMTQVLALIEEEPGITIGITSTNDRPAGLTDFQTTLQLEKYQNLLTKVGGHWHIWLVDWPRGDGNGGAQSGGLTGTQLSYHLATGQWERDQAVHKGVDVIDNWPDMVNTSSSTCKLLDTLTYDGLHLGPPGAYIVAQPIVTLFEQKLPVRSRLPATAFDRYSSTNTRGNLIDDGLFAGTGGTAGTNCSGSVATGWVTAAGASLTAVCSKVTVGGYDYQQVVLTGTASGAHDNGPPLVVDDVSFILSHALDPTDLVEGDVIEAVCAAEFDSSTGLRGIPIQIKITSGGDDEYVVGGEPNMASNSSFPNLRFPSVALSGVNMTPQITVPAGFDSGTDTVSVRLLVVAHASEAINATVRFGRCSVRKVIA